MKDLKVIFMGTPEFSVPVLEKLIQNTNVIMVITQPDKEIGRKKILTPSPVKIKANEYNIPVFTPKKLREKENVLKVINEKPDLIVTCAFGQIITKEILDLPRLGCINVHASLLPAYRGASPINAVLRDGLKETGITIMYMDEGIDTGNIIAKKSLKIDMLDNYKTLSDKLSILGAEILMETLPSIINGTNQSIKQDESLSNYVGLIKREDERIDFSKTREEVYNFIRSLNPVPYANTLFKNEEMKILEARIGKEGSGEIGLITSVNKDSFNIMCKDGEIEITKIKPFGKKEMYVKDFFNGYKKEQMINIRVGV